MSSSSPDFNGAYLSISWLNALLYMLEITLAIYYFTRFKTKPSLQLLLYGLLLADTLCIMIMFASTWMLLIKSFEAFTLMESRWTVPVSTFIVIAIGATEELFLVVRCRRLFRSTLILAILFSMISAHAILELYSSCYAVAFPEMGPDARRYVNKGVAIGASIAATVDWVIPLALILQIYQVTPPQISKQRSWKDTIVNTVSSGGCAGIMSIVLLVLLWVRIDVYYILANTMGRVYVITVFVNLIVSKRRSSPYDVPIGLARRSKVSFSANIMLRNFAKPERPDSPVLGNEVVQTPEDVLLKENPDIEYGQTPTTTTTPQTTLTPDDDIEKP